MATHDYVIANGTGAAVRSDLNDALAAIVSNNSGSSEPATTYAYQWWADTTANVLKIRNSANNAWITLRELDGTMLIEDGSASTPGLAFADDVNTGIFSPAADQIGFATGGAERLEIGSSEVVFNDPSNDVDFRVESNGNTHMLFVDAGNDRVGIGDSTPTKPLTLGTSTPVILLDDQSSRTLEVRGPSSTDTASVLTTSNHDLSFGTNDTERARIDSSGRLLVGVSSSRSVGFAHTLQIEGTDAATSTQSFVRNSNDSSGPQIDFAKTRGTSTGSNTVVQDDDNLGTIKFRAADGTDTASTAAEIGGQIDGTPGSNDTPGRLVFKTCADGASSSTERVRIDNSGRVGVATTPEAWSGFDVLEVNEASIASSGSGDAFFTANAYYDGAWKYKDAGVARNIYMNADGIVFRQAASGSADAAVAWSESMRVDTSGRLLINHTADTSPVGYQAKLQLCDTSFQGSSLSIRRDGGASGPTLIFTKSRGTTKGANTIVQSGDNVGTLRWFAADGTDANSEVAQIRAQIDNTPGSNDTPGRLIFKTTSDGASDVTERMRIDSNGFTKITNDSSFLNSAGTYHEIRTNTADWAARISNSHGSIPYGIAITYSVTPNGTSSEFLYCDDSTALRAAIRSNGGLANYQSNNANLCDEREKKNIEPLDSTWGCLKNWDLKKFHYNEDADTDDKRYGVIAQQVAEHCPEVITDWVKQKAEDAVLDEDGNVVTPAVEEVTRMGVKEQQMMWMAIKALQEAQARIETLEAKVAALEAG
jgi:hypothetical protein